MRLIAMDSDVPRQPRIARLRAKLLHLCPHPLKHVPMLGISRQILQLVRILREVVELLMRMVKERSERPRPKAEGRFPLDRPPGSR